MSSDDYNTAYVACVNLCSLGPCSNQRYGQTEATTSLPPGTTPDTGTNVPGSLLPGPGYHPTPATNWWRVGGALILGLGVGIFLYRRGIHHAA